MGAQSAAEDHHQHFTRRTSASRSCPRIAVSAHTRKFYVALEWVALAVLAISLVSASVTLATRSLPDEIQTRPVRIERGDSLWSVAAAYPVDGLSTAETADLIRRANGMQGSAVYAGQLIQVPDTTASQRSLAQR